MGSPIYDSSASVRQLLDRGFQMPIHFAAIGVNGSILAGTFERVPDGVEMECQITAEAQRSEGLALAINILYVDSRGETAIVVVRPRPEPVLH